METAEEQLEAAERRIIAAEARVWEVVRLDEVGVGTTRGIPDVAPPGQEYVDPYLFEIGHFRDREEYEELSRKAKITPRAKA